MASRHLTAGGALLGAALLSGFLAATGVAATPASDTISTSDTTSAWSGALLTGANADESTCVEGVTCDTFILTLAPGDYTNRRIQVRIEWLLPANDYDLYIHEGSPTGPQVGDSGGSITTFEQAVVNVNRVTVAPIVYYVHVVGFAVAPGDPYSGRADLLASANPRTPVYVTGTSTFSENVTLYAPEAASDGEPSIRVDVQGNCYVGGIRGVPAGVDLWRFDLDPQSPGFDPGLQNATYLGQPDAFLSQDPFDTTAGGADGGGDIDIAVSFPSEPDSTPVVTIISLAAANISSAYSFDRGETFTLSPATAIVPADDRQWCEADGDNRVYMMYRAPIPATGLFMAVSNDHGLTYPTASLVNLSGTTPGYIDVDHANGNVYVAHESASALTVSVSEDGGVTWKSNTVDNTTGHDSLFDVVKVGDDGTVYAAWSDGSDIYLSHSTDGGVNWAEPARADDRTVYRTNLFPWLEAGSDGRVCLVWYGTPNNANNDAADWDVLYAYCDNARDPSPVFHQQVISDHVIHGSNISLGGLGGADNRNLADYFQVALDPQGAAVIAFTDDHNDFSGHVYVIRQLDGPGLYASANGGSGVVDPVSPPPLPDPDPADPEVWDFLHDAVTGLLVPIATDNAFDILSIDYGCDIHAPSGEPMVVGVMTLSSLDSIPAGINWRINLTANAPGGVSDRGDQYYLLADATNPAAIAYTWGTAVRNGDGSLSYTERGGADLGAVDVGAGTVTVGVRHSALDAFSTHGGVSMNTVFHGLRGASFTPGANGVRDITRGGSAFNCAVLGVPGDAGNKPAASFLGVPNPNPMRSSASISFRLDRAGMVDLSVFDVQGRRVRSLLAGLLDAGEYTRTWDGRTDRFSEAPGGVYFFVLHGPGETQTRKIVRRP